MSHADCTSIGDQQCDQLEKSAEHSAASASSPMAHHTTVVLFYKYFLPPSSTSPAPSSRSTESDKQDDDDASIFRANSSLYLPKLIQHQKSLCQSLHMKGRILLSSEGVNGTLSAANDQIMQMYIDAMNSFDLVRDLGPPSEAEGGHNDNFLEDDDKCSKAEGRMGLFCNIDWKLSSVNEALSSKIISPFPDLKISSVKEIVSTGGSVTINEIQTFGGKHLSPEEFHEALLGQDEDAVDEFGKKREVVLIDVRNTFEHAIGHFVNPTGGIDRAEQETDTTVANPLTTVNANESKDSGTAVASNAAATPGSTCTSTPAINPRMTNFTQFDTQFCTRNAESLKDKRVLMYCTGGIRCEKASCMLRKRGVDNVSQLSGGIARYLERYGNEGLFHGKNFTFDQRISLDPKDCLVQTRNGDESHSPAKNPEEKTSDVVGMCLECNVPFDEISGSRVCTVCRDLVLICPGCQKKLREFHCSRHAAWKDCFYTFLEVYDVSDLEGQLSDLKRLRDELVPPSDHKCMRKTLSRQMEKVTKRLKELKSGNATVNSDAPRHCRTCYEPNDVCAGLCWGFWKNSGELTSNERPRGRSGSMDDEGAITKKARAEENQEILDIAVGDLVIPGPDWNELRLGNKYVDSNRLRRGKVVELKSWGSGNVDQKDCAVVIWDELSRDTSTEIYRWGVLAKNGKRMYDLQKLQT